MCELFKKMVIKFSFLLKSICTKMEKICIIDDMYMQKWKKVLKLCKKDKEK